MPKNNPILEELPVSEYARERIHVIAHTPYKGQLKKLGGLSLFHAVRDGKITLAEQEIIKGEIAAREQLLTVTPGQPPEEVPEAPAQPWSPTAGLTNEGVERERDWAERAYKD